MIRYRAESIGFDDEGDYVKYTDHTAALAAERAKVRELVDALKVAASDQMRLSCVYCHRDDNELERATDKRYDASVALIEKHKEEPNGLEETV